MAAPSNPHLRLLPGDGLATLHLLDATTLAAWDGISYNREYGGHDIAQTKRRKVIRALAKGQVTIPSEFREALGIEAETLLSVSLVGDHLEIAPLHPGEEGMRRYTDEDVARFLKEDKLDQETARKVRDLLQRANEAYALLRSNPSTWKEEQDERRSWDKALADDLYRDQ